MGAPYGGTATFVSTANNQTRVLIELKAKAWYTALFVLIGLAVLALAGAAGGEDDPAIVAVGAIAAIMVAGTLYLYYVPWPQQVIEKLQSGVHGAVPAFETSPAAPAATQTPATPMPNSSPSQPQAGIAEQLRQLGELHKAGLITEAEFESKKTDLLSRVSSRSGHGSLPVRRDRRACIGPGPLPRNCVSVGPFTRQRRAGALVDHLQDDLAGQARRSGSLLRNDFPLAHPKMRSIPSCSATSEMRDEAAGQRRGPPRRDRVSSGVLLTETDVVAKWVKHLQSPGQVLEARAIVGRSLRVCLAFRPTLVLLNGMILS